MEKDIRELEERLGYRFADERHLSLALNHSSYANEHRAEKMPSNERLEFLGDSVLGFVTAEYLYLRYGEIPEGDLTRRRASLVCEQSLYRVAQSIHLGSYLNLGHGEELGGGRQRPSILADAMEAVFAAVYLDGGMEAASALIYRVLLDHEQEHSPGPLKDYKTMLQEICQHKGGKQLSYRLIEESGPDHNKRFTVEALLGSESVGTGTGRSKKEAEQDAARDALERLPEQ